MTAVPLTGIDGLREELVSLPWADRFDRLAAVEKSTPVGEQRRLVGQLRDELAEQALAELSGGWGTLPLKEGVLRLPSKKMRAALGRAAKQARDRRVVEVMASGAAPLAGAADSAQPFAMGLDERAIELPLALQTARLGEPGEVLDAGSALNLAVVRQIIGRPVARVTHFTLPGVNEPVLAGDEDRFIHVSGDLREMTFAAGAFDRVVCVSTLEHVGMDNARYGATTENAAASAAAAVSELIRVLAPAGELLLTVPFGRAADHGWFRVFDAESLSALLAPAMAEQVDVRYFHYSDGWIDDGAAPCVPDVDPGFFPDVVTGIAVARVVKTGARR